MNEWFAFFSELQLWVFEHLLQPLVGQFGLEGYIDDAFEGAAWLVVGVMQLLVMVLIIVPLQRWRPVETVQPTEQAERRQAVRTDVLYTLLHRLGLFRVLVFFSLSQWFFDLTGWLHMQGLGTFQLDKIWPGVTDGPIPSFLLYLFAFDLVDYWIHRGQHHFNRWWALHALHHSQRHMTLWTDNRNHLLDSVLRDVLMSLVGILIGVEPGQFVFLVATMLMVESFSHANLRLSFGAVGERLLVSPRFHRHHHSIGVGHERPGQKYSLGGCNFAVLFPVWDILFGTANFEHRFEPTGIRDQLPNEGGRDYGQGFWSQQWLGLKRLVSST